MVLPGVLPGDITPIYQNRPATIKQERGVHDRTLQDAPSCLAAMGGGDSPTLAYDRYVVSRALEYLQQDHEKPQFLCVGTYAPHYPYVAPRELYDYYHDRVAIPEASFHYPEHPALAGKKARDMDPEVVRAARAAYYGMVEFEDRQIGAVYEAFQAYLKRTGHEGVFVYVSDHGDQIGDRGYYGKNVFYEQSSHTPMVFVGDGIPRGRRLFGATSLMDLGPTLCELAGAPLPPAADGRSLCPQLAGGEDDLERMVIAEVGGSMGPRCGRLFLWPDGQVRGVSSTSIMMDMTRRTRCMTLMPILKKRPTCGTAIRSWWPGCGPCWRKNAGGGSDPRGCRADAGKPGHPDALRL